LTPETRMCLAPCASIQIVFSASVGRTRTSVSSAPSRTPGALSTRGATGSSWGAVGPIVVQASLLVAASIITESGLSYLGYGVQPPTATWGNLLRDAQPHIQQLPIFAIAPGMMIFLTVMSINFVGDGLRDALDPYGRR